MPMDDSERSLSDGGTFAGQAKVDRDDVSLGGEATFAGSSKRRAADVSLGDERTLGGGDAAGLDTVIEDIEVVDLEARYRIEGTLGQGGMGAVLLATDTRLDRKVAIKRILGEAARSKTAIMRFLTEAKSIAALNHPNIVQIHDYGRAKDGPFLIMEYVDGGSLADRCRQGAVSLEEAVHLACQLCDGLAKAHDAGIVHRDIKPANVLLSRDGHPKLTDFGLAKAESADHGMTMTGAVMGTPDFMPPEQRRDAAEVDHRSDLWSLAATVYQMVTGRSPKIIRFDLLPGELTKVLGKALEEEKDDRYQTVRDFRDALKTSLRGAAVVVHDVAEGTCGACGVPNDPSRKFCRGCGESLLAPCLACGESTPIWDEICGSCGAKQTPLADERRQAMAAKQAEAEGLLGDFEFDRAAAIASELRDEGHPKLKHLSAWATRFLQQTETARTEQIAKAVESIRQAIKHEAAHDYPSAVGALETVPGSLGDSELPGLTEPAKRMLDRIKQKQGEIHRLETLIKERIATKQLDELLPEVEKLLGLRPDREDVRKIRSQLVERAQRQAAVRDHAVARAKAAIANHDYEAACAALSGVSAAAVTAEVVSLREHAESLVRQVRSLGRAIKDAANSNHLILLETADRYLQLKPGDAEIQTLRQSLVEREAKISAEIAARLEQAGQLEQACRFHEAKTLLTGVPETRRKAAVVAAIERAGWLSNQRQAALEALRRATGGTSGAAIKASGGYRDAIAEAQITDREFSTLLAKAETQYAEELRRQRMKSLAVKTAAVIAAGIAAIVGGLWIRSSAREAAIAEAIERGCWDEALAIAPLNPKALVGRARSKLEADPADTNGALADLEQASRQPMAGADRGAITELWQRLVDGRIATLDGTGLELACEKSNDAGLAAAQAAWWIRFGTAAAGPPHENGGEVIRAVEKAVAAGASAEAVAPLRARAKLLAAVTAQQNGDEKTAISELYEAASFDPGLVQTTLTNPVHAALQTIFLAVDHRRKFYEAVGKQDWPLAVKIVAAAKAVDKSAAGWVADAAAPLTPAELASLPSAAILDFSPASMLKLPPIQNSLGIEFRLIPGGTFTMGQAGGKAKGRSGDPDEIPHQVTLTKPFYLGAHEVTNAQWKQVMGSLPLPGHKNDDRPVEMVSWEDAIEFCQRLSALPEERKAGRVYRLPTEAEWEYACRAGTTTEYSFGDNASQLGEYAWYDGDTGIAETHPVGKKKPNDWGMYDMYGNVTEWCSDWYGAYPKGAVTDPKGPTVFGTYYSPNQRVMRGGSVGLNDASSFRSASRSWGDPQRRYQRVGFRLALGPWDGTPSEADK